MRRRQHMLGFLDEILLRDETAEVRLVQRLARQRLNGLLELQQRECFWQQLEDNRAALTA